MPLIEKEIEVKLGNRNISYYEGLGYYIPRYKDKLGRLLVKHATSILVEVKHLQKKLWSKSKSTMPNMFKSKKIKV